MASAFVVSDEAPPAPWRESKFPILFLFGSSCTLLQLCSPRRCDSLGRFHMVVIKESVNNRGLNFRNQRKAVILRTRTPRLAFRNIAQRVRNLKKVASTEDVVRRVFWRFNMNKGRVHYNYVKCRRKPWKVTKEVGSYLVNQLRKERRHTVCTSTSLQADLCRDKKVHLSSSAVRKHLLSKGYTWKPRGQKRKYSHAMRINRVSFTAQYYTKSPKAIHKAVSCAMDSVVLTAPPTDAVDRKNYCCHGITHMCRKDSKAASPELAGDDPYEEQVPIQHAIPMWGAISPQGFREIVSHRTRKLKNNDWVKVLKARKLKQVVQQLRATGPAPWKVLCDSESFLEAKPCRTQYKKQHRPHSCPQPRPRPNRELLGLASCLLAIAGSSGLACEAATSRQDSI